MREFEYYINKKDVKKVSPDKQLAISLIKDMEERVDEVIKLDIKIFSKIIFENVYDALREFCDALLAVEGYKSYSHEGSISFLIKKGFDVAFISALDNFRYKRNGSKYYAQRITSEDAKSIIEFYVKELDRKPHHKWCGCSLSTRELLNLAILCAEKSTRDFSCIQKTSAFSNHGF